MRGWHPREELSCREPLHSDGGLGRLGHVSAQHNAPQAMQDLGLGPAWNFEHVGSLPAGAHT